MAYYEDIILYESGKVKCILCDTLVQDKNHSIDAHINNREHNKLYLKRLMIQNSIVLTENKLHCLICKRDIDNLPGIKVHIQTSSHQNIMSSITNTVKKDGALIELPENITNRNKVHCLVCDNDIDFTTDSIKDHINSSKHMRARSITLQPYNGIFSVEGCNDHLWCKICQVYFENYIEVILNHVDDDVEHRMRLSEILKVIEAQNITIEKYLTIPKEDKAFCMKCHIEVPCSVDNLDSHVKGKRHKSFQ